MNAITSLLTHQHLEIVLDLMAEISRDFGVEKGGWPHFSYHVAAQYNPVINERLRRSVDAIPRFTIQTAGLGIFTGPEPVIYITIVRAKHLAALHRSLWRLGQSLGQEPARLYAPPLWVPHITLARITSRQYILPEIMRAIGGRDFHWQIPIDNLALLSDDEGETQLKMRWSLEGRTAFSES